ncbi:MAG: glutamate 5-kinase [Synechococcales cyanobacterium CRU_2_2]|nr:glutamate 5-kinase [Synechococcales cyanobacterium CRU_2_2]
MSEIVVVKIGTSSLTQPETGLLALANIATLVETLSQLRQQNYDVILVSSGAVGIGCARLGLTERPKTIDLKQAVAAVGQGRLMRTYDDLFASLGQPIAQVLLTRGDFERRASYVSVRRTLRKLLEIGVVPVVNENDTVSYDELKFGDNDTLSAQLADLIGAHWLFILTDVDRLYSADPRHNPDAEPIVRVTNLSELESAEIGGQGSQWGTGGMATKIRAAGIATKAGVRTVITQGRSPQNILKILQGEPIGTCFDPQASAASARKRWIAHGTLPSGRLFLDTGAVSAIAERGKSLLSAGIAALEGEFQSEDAVILCNAQGREIARGLVNYSSAELQLIRGQKSDQIESILGYVGAETVIHRDNLVLS